MARANWRPAAIAWTTSEAPLTASPAAKTPDISIGYSLRDNRIFCSGGSGRAAIIGNHFRYRTGSCNHIYDYQSFLENQSAHCLYYCFGISIDNRLRDNCRLDSVVRPPGCLGKDRDETPYTDTGILRGFTSHCYRHYYIRNKRIHLVKPEQGS